MKNSELIKKLQEYPEDMKVCIKDYDGDFSSKGIYPDKDIARLIYNCYSEIENSEKMIEELKKALNENGDLELKDNWGNSRGLELRIPNDVVGSYSIRQVPFHLALDVIEEHIENQKKELLRLKEVCKVQLH